MTTSLTHALLNESGAEVLKALRAPEFIIPTLALPVAFYSLFGVAMSGSEQNALYMLATYGVFAVMGPAIFGFGAGVANERDRGWLMIKRAAPAPALSYIGAKLIATLLVATLSLALIYMVAGFVGGVALERSQWLLLYVTHIASVLPFILIGLSLGFLFSTNGAIAFSNIVFLGLAALGGLWIPIFVLPATLQKFATFLPSFHLGEIALQVVGARGEHIASSHFYALVPITGVLLVATLLSWAHQRKS